jgi:UDP-N-acetylglucosamine acyltransferase
MEFKGIHQTAIIHKNAELGDNITVGPYAVIGENVKLGNNVIVGSHALIEGYTKIGNDCKIFPKAMVGTDPQDLKYKKEKSFVEIGENNVIRECVTINPGTHENEVTKIGNNNLIMAYSHVAHNCEVGSNVIMANAATLAGHVVLEDFVVIGGLSAVHQFVKIGEYVMVGGCTGVVKDVVPFCLINGYPAVLSGLNNVGLKRRGFTVEQRLILKKAYKILFRQGLAVTHAVEKIKQEVPLNEHIQLILDFIEKSERGIAH